MSIAGIATGLATPYATAYLPGSSSTVTPPDEGSGYGTGYATGYATPYLPGAEATPFVLPITFVAAIAAAFEANETLVESVVGGLWHRRVPPGQPYPNAKFVVVPSTNMGSGGQSLIQRGRVTFSIYDRSPTEAKLIAEILSIAYPVGLADAPMVWTNGRIMYFRPVDPASPDLSSPGPGGSLVQPETRVFAYTFQSAYTPDSTPLTPY